MFDYSKMFNISEKKNTIYNNFKSPNKDKILKSNFFKNNDDLIKDDINNKKFEKINLIDNELIKVNSLNKFENNNNFTNINNLKEINFKTPKKKFLSYNNLDIKLFFNISNKQNHIKESSKEFHHYNITNQKNILNNIQYILFNKNFCKYKYNKDFNDYNKKEKNNKYLFTTLKKKNNDNLYYNSQINKNKIEYIKKIIRDYYFENFDSTKQLFNDINKYNNNYLTIEDFVLYLKEIIKINLEKKEIRTLLYSNGISKVDYSKFKHIFFPEETNNKISNLKLKNAKSNLIEINKKEDKSTCTSYRKRNSGIKSEENMPFIGKRVMSIENIHNSNTKLYQKFKFKNLNKKINCNLININKNLYINNIKNNKNNKNIESLKTIINKKKIFQTMKNFNTDNLELFLLKKIIERNFEKNASNIKEIDIKNIINKNRIHNNTIIKTENNKVNNLYKISKLNDLIKNKKIIVENNNKITKPTKANNLSIFENENKYKENSSTYFNTHKNRTLNKDKKSKNNVRDLLFHTHYNNFKFFNNDEKFQNLKETKTSDIKKEYINREKNSDILNYL